jgi:hypothetical protein
MSPRPPPYAHLLTPLRRGAPPCADATLVADVVMADSDPLSVPGATDPTLATGAVL